MIPKLFVALFVLAASCATTRGVDRGPKHASCVDGDYAACVAWGDSEARQGPEGRRNALIAYQFGCTGNHAESCGRLAELFGHTTADPARIKATLDSACQGGDQPSCVEYAKLLPRRKAMQFYKAACDVDVGEGCARLAEAYRDAWHLSDYLTQSVQLDEKSCRLGYLPGCVGAGQAYLFGSGVAADPAKGLELLQSTCSDREASGCALLAKIYEEGMGVPVDLQRSNAFYEIAAKQEQAQTITTAQSAFVVYVDGCNRGDTLGCFNAAVMLQEGIEVDRNVATARELFQQSCSDGCDLACERMKRIRTVVKKLSESK